MLHTCSNDGTTLSFDIDLIIRPERRMRHEALELLDTRPVRNVSLCCETGRNHEVFGLASTAICSLDMPFASLSIKFGTDDHAFECRVTLDVQNFVAMVEVVS